jgi:hypothetical protein
MKQRIPLHRSVMLSNQKTSSSQTRGVENKKLSTPMKPIGTAAANAIKRTSFTAPRPVSKPAGDQKLNINAVRKSLMKETNIEPKTPAKNSPIKNPKTRQSLVRRSVSLKTPVPAVKVTDASPTKLSSLASTPTPKKKILNYPTKISSTPNSRRSSFSAADKSHQNVRPVVTNSRTSLNPNRASINPYRPSTAATSTQKTEFKAPFPKGAASNHRGSMV